MKCLGIESTAHTFSCAVVDRKGKHGEILSDIRKIYGPPDGEGIHPREASRHHVETSSTVLSEALRKAKISVDDLDIISYAAGPGLGPCLRVGAVVSRALSSYYKIPIYPVNHAIGHIELGKMLTGAKNPLVLLVSGGHTMLLAFSDKKWRVFGETLDITLGQLLDQFGRSIGFASPCGKKIEDLAERNHNYIPLAACYSLQETAFAMICEATERALAFTKKKELMIVGGVAANKRLSAMLTSICKRQNCKFFVVPPKFAGDCGSQIAWLGLLEASVKKGTGLKNTFVKQSWRLDTVKVSY